MAAKRLSSSRTTNIEDGICVLQTYTGEAAGDQFGWVSSDTDDQDNDERNDLIITAPTNDARGNSAGRVYVYSSSSATNPTHAIHTLTGTVALAQFGYATGDAGDLTGDGLSDIQVGAPFANTGAVYLYSGADRGLIDSLFGERSGNRFGISVCPGLDHNSDGVDDFLSTGAWNPVFGTNTGRVYLIEGVNPTPPHARRTSRATGFQLLRCL